MRGISKSFPGVKALDKVDLKVRRGSVHALMGENGAGKSTLMKCLFGIYLEDEGEIFLDGKKVHFENPKEAMENGVSMVHQELNQVLQRSAAENMMLGRFPKKSIFVDEKKMYEDTKKIFDDIGLDISPKIKMGKLSVSQRQMAEIAKAVSYNAKVLILDEPTSSLTDQEVEKLFEVLEMLKKRGIGIVYISHKMEEIKQISDDITVFRDGKWVATERAENLSNKDIVSLMVGRPLENRFPEKTNKPGKVILKVENLNSLYPDGVKDINFSLREGEILGIAGLVGSRRTELLESIFGSRQATGKLFLEGKEIKNKDPKVAIKNGFAYLTEERRSTGIFPMLDLKENSTLASIKKYKNGPFVSEALRNKATKWVIESMNVKTPSSKTKIASLSGGNQQKVIIGRWLLTVPKVLLLDEPTRGIDVGAKFEIYKLILDLCNENKAVIVVSSELPELLGICDRILVMSNGRLAGIEDAKNLTQEKIMELAGKYL